MKNSTLKLALTLVAGLASNTLRTHAAAVYQETGGRVVVEAEHYHARTTSASNHRWAVIPDESGAPDTPADPGFANARGGKYVQSLPDALNAGENRNTDTGVVGTGNVIDYKVNITTVGSYRLYLRWGGYDGASDSMYAEIVELRDGITGGQADWYRFSANIAGDFATAANTATGGTAAGWNGSGAPAGSADQISGGPAGEVPAVWAISAAGIYTIRISQREDGSAVDAFILQQTSLAEPTDPGPAESALSTSYVLITQQPADGAAAPGGTATFTVAAEGTGTLTYQWQRAAPGGTNFVNIAGATGTNYTTGTLAEADNGAKYRVAVSIPGVTVNSRAATLITDSTPPTIWGRSGGGSAFNRVTVYFSEPLSPSTATNAANYSASGGLTLSNPTLGGGGTSVTLTTTSQTTNAAYTITVKDVRDATGINVISPNPSTTTFHGQVLGPGIIVRRVFTGIGGGTLVADLTNAPSFIADQPNLVTYQTAFEAPGGFGDNYGQQMRGYLSPPVTGAYVFFFHSDDNGVLYLGTDETPSKRLIATETTWSNGRQWVSSGGASDLTAKRSDQFSGSEWTPPNQITLTAGKLYYIEALMKEGGGGDFLGVTWVLPGGTDPVDGAAPIPGSALFSYYNPDGKVTITQQPQNQSVNGGSPATFSITATGSSDFGTNVVYQWQRAAAGSTTFSNITNATSAQYTIPFTATGDNGSQFRTVASSLIGGLSIDYSRTTSSIANLTVGADATAPTVAGILGTVQSVRVTFSEPLDAATATNAANYRVSGTVTVTKADVVSAAGQAGVVALTATGVTAGQNYTLTVTGVKDLAGNTIVSAPQGFDVFHIVSTFNDGNVPTGAGIGGAARILNSGSYDGSGLLELTTNLGSLQGGIIYGDVLSGAAVNKFTALFKVFVGRGSGNPADGYSFSIGSDLPDPTSGATTSEEGTGSGLIVAFDTYDNGGAEAPAFSVKWGGTEFAKTNVAKAAMVNNQWSDVIIRVNADGTIDLYHNNVRYFNKEPIPGWAPLTGPSVMLGARTGGEFEVHWFDDLKILYNADVAIAEPPTVTITSPANNARLPANSSVTITVNAQAPGSSVTKVEYIANGTSLGTSTTAPYSFTVPSAPTGAYLITARVTAANGITVSSAPVKVVVGNPEVILLVTADPGPLTFPGDQAVYEHLLSRGYDVQTTTGTDVPDDGSTAIGKVLVVVTSSLGSGTTVAAAGGSKFKNLAIPVINWEASNADDLGFQPANGATTANQTDLRIVDAGSPLAAGFPAGLVTVVTSPQTFSQSAPVGAHIVATLAGDQAQAVIYNYDKGETGDAGFVMTGRRVFFFFQDNTATAANANGWKLFDASMDWALNKTATAAPRITSSTLSGGNITVQWTGGGTLESAASLTAPINWTSTGNSSGSFTEPAATGNKYYRVRR